MKIIDAISRIDSLKHNTYTQADKVAWLSTLDGMVKVEIIDTHEGGEDVTFNGYNASTVLNKKLLIPEPYAEVYLRWLEAQIDYYNGEYEKYNNSMDMFNTAYNGFKNYYNRTHMPLGKKINYFGRPATIKHEASDREDVDSVSKISETFLFADKWEGSGNLYSQVVQVDGVTANSQVDLNPSVEQLAVFYDKSLAFVAENEDGVVTVYAIGQKPENDYTMQVTITEVRI